MAALRDHVLFGHDASGLEDRSANAASGSCASLALEPGPAGTPLHFEFELAGTGAFAIARRELALALPPRYVVKLRLRGHGRPNELQLKLVDPSGANVWWWRRPDFEATDETMLVTFRPASLAFAWGPRSGGEPREVGAVEVAVAGEGGGSLWIDDFRIEPRALATGPPRARVVAASSDLAASRASASPRAVGSGAGSASRQETHVEPSFHDQHVGAASRSTFSGLEMVLVGHAPGVGDQADRGNGKGMRLQELAQEQRDPRAEHGGPQRGGQLRALQPSRRRPADAHRMVLRHAGEEPDAILAARAGSGWSSSGTIPARGRRPPVVTSRPESP